VSASWIFDDGVLTLMFCTSVRLLFDSTAPLVLEELAYCGDVHGYR
jgi:hypothetical protein